MPGKKNKTSQKTNFVENSTLIVVCVLSGALVAFSYYFIQRTEKIKRICYYFKY